jgi:DNA-binding transcriptional ArsR family regulator
VAGVNASAAENRQRALKALAHPLRVRILSALKDDVRSPGDLAAELEVPLGVASYHVRMLRDYDCVELVRTEPRRGALQHFYKATAIGSDMEVLGGGSVDASILGRLRDVRSAIEDNPASAITQLDAIIEQIEGASCAG